MFREVEKQFRVIHPDISEATYESILNYSTEKDNPYQRWYRYKEGFSVQFIEKIVEEYGNTGMDTLGSFCRKWNHYYCCKPNGVQGNRI